MLNQEILEYIQRAVASGGMGAGTHQLDFRAGQVRCSFNASSVPGTRAVEPKQARAEGDPAEPGADGKSADGSIEFMATGTASSTSVDSYGTEMSRACLEDMAAQFSNGVEIFVGHGSWMSSLEWDKAIGITTGAECKDAQVVNAADPAESGMVCTVEMHFSADADSPPEILSACKQLRKRMQQKRPMGLSIGGWFRSCTYTLNDEGYIDRIIINKVDLDHLATTRRPANPDCLDMAEVRSVLSNAIQKARDEHSKQPEPAVVPVAPVAVPVDPAAARAAEPAPMPAKPATREIDPEDPKLEDSKYEQPPHDYVTDLKANWHDIWDAGGNTRGNDAYALWSKYLDGDRSEEVLDWVVEREGWAARHFKDFELPGVMAQLKWGVVGEKGWDHQKQVIEDRKAELEDVEDEVSESDKEPDADLSAPTPDQPTEPAAQDDAASLSSSSPAPSPVQETPTDPALAPRSQDHQETTMLTDADRAAIAELINAALSGRGAPPAGQPTTPNPGTDDADQRRGSAQPPAPKADAPQPLPGADLIRARGLVRTITSNPDYRADSNVKEFHDKVLRMAHFGTDEVVGERQGVYREPSGNQQRALWLGLSTEMRAMELGDLADLCERAAPVLGLDVRGWNAVRGNVGEFEQRRATIDSECRILLSEALNYAARSSHPKLREPDTREAVQRSLTVSGASDKVTTALVSSLLQQLSNIQLGARTQLRRVPAAGTAYQTPKRTVSSTLAEFVADGTAPTEDSGSWGYDTWSYKTLATRIRVTRKAVRQGMQWGDIVAAEVLYKGEDANRQEEIALFQGDSANNLPTANSFNGLLTYYGAISGQTVANTTATAGDVLSLTKLDRTVNSVRGRETKSNMRIFASEKGHEILNRVLQADQIFSNVTMVDAGFIVQTYHGIPVIESSGIPDTLVWNGTDTRITKWTTGATTALVVVNLVHNYLAVLTPMTLEQVAATTAQYADYEMYCDEVLVMDNSYGAAILGGIKVE